MQLDLDCPFCGAKSERFRNEASGEMTMVQCVSCGASAFYVKWNRRAALKAQEPVGEVSEMPGSNGGFTMAVFRASDVPLGSKLYTAPPSLPTTAGGGE